MENDNYHDRDNNYNMNNDHYDDMDNTPKLKKTYNFNKSQNNCNSFNTGPFSLHLLEHHLNPNSSRFHYYAY